MELPVEVFEPVGSKNSCGTSKAARLARFSERQKPDGISPLLRPIEGEEGFTLAEQFYVMTA
jgi:hypothetical protein